jgi:hypothetical protein
VIFVAVLVLGVVLAGVNIWQRLGRSPRARAWARGRTPTQRDRKVLVLWPTFAVLAICAGALGLSAGTALVVPFGICFLAAAVTFLLFAVLPVPVPRFVMPRWYAAGADRA